jgi:hypothetical protein
VEDTVLLDEVGRKEMLAVGRVRKFFESLVKTLRHPSPAVLAQGD